MVLVLKAFHILCEVGKFIDKLGRTLISFASLIEEVRSDNTFT